MDLSGLNALVTGAGSQNGIGFAIAKTFHEHGAKVAITSRSARIHERGRELGIPSFDCDLTDEVQVEQLIGQVGQILGSLDIVVNNAGMTSVSHPADSESNSVDGLSLSDWRLSIARNLDSAFLTTKYALPLLRQSRNARIIFVASATGPIQAMRNDAGYAAAKAGVVGLARALAVDEAPMTANVIAPGWIATESQTPHESRQGGRIPLGRSGRPDEVAGAALWLASASGGFTTGQIITIDGGNSIAEERE